MALRESLTAERLRELLDYDPQTGVFCVISTGRKAGFVRLSGYVGVNLLGAQFYAHRLAWLWVHGRWPDECIDHINGERADNRIANLRAVCKRVNDQNRRKARRGSKTGVLGVNATASGTFVAQISIDGKSIGLGTFKTPQEAHEIYIAAKRRLHEGNTL